MGTMNETLPRLPDLVELYLTRCRVEGKSPRTLLAYGWTLRRFLGFLERDGGPSDIRAVGPDHVLRYLDRFTDRSRETRHRYFREVRCFFRWGIAAGYCDQDPFRGLRNVRLPPRIVAPFSISDIAQLLAACDSTTDAGRRDRAMVLILLDTGIRCSECVGLTLDDCDLPAGRLRIRHGKGNKQRVVSFAGRCRDALAAYLDRRGLDPGALFVALTPHGRLAPPQPLQANGLKQMLRRLGRKTGLPKVHAHRFRHTFATWAIQHDARELDVQHLLGHSSPDMVRRYSST